MANKFTKSVQERDKRDAIRKSTAEPEAPISIPAVPAAQTASVSFTPADKAAVPHRIHIRREPRRMAKNKTFYLDVEVGEAVRRTAEEEGVTDSRLVNDILRSILLSPEEI